MPSILGWSRLSWPISIWPQTSFGTVIALVALANASFGEREKCDPIGSPWSLSEFWYYQVSSRSSTGGWVHSDTVILLLSADPLSETSTLLNPVTVELWGLYGPFLPPTLFNIYMKPLGVLIWCFGTPVSSMCRWNPLHPCYIRMRCSCVDVEPVSNGLDECQLNEAESW